MIRYLDFSDSYLAKGETCHPSDNIGAILAAAEYAGISGRDLLVALAVAYQVQCVLSDVAPVRAKGFDHTVQLSYSIAGGVSKALGMDEKSIANAIGICGTALNALRVTRTGTLSHWKGLAAPATAFCCVHATFLAMRGMTGPLEVFEGNKGFMESISGPFQIDWSTQNLEKVTSTILKKYNAEIHSQSTLDGLLDLKSAQGLRAEDVEHIDIAIFDVAFNIIGGCEGGDKKAVRTKEQADHSLPYLVAVALLDGGVTPRQFLAERNNQTDVQTLLRKVTVRPSDDLSRRFPSDMSVQIDVWLRNGQKLSIAKAAYEGFSTHPMSWETAVEKFARLSEPYTDHALRDDLVACVRIHPATPGNRVTSDQYATLAVAIPKILNASLERGGTTSARAHLAAEIARPDEDQMLNVYGRSARPCPRCATPIVRIVLGGRGSYFCPTCQPPPNRGLTKNE